MSPATMAAGEYSASRSAVGANHTAAVDVRRRVRPFWAVIGSANRKCNPANMPEQQNQASNESPNTHPIMIGRGSRSSATFQIAQVQTTQPVTNRLEIGRAHV